MSLVDHWSQPMGLGLEETWSRAPALLDGLYEVHAVAPTEAKERVHVVASRLLKMAAANFLMRILAASHCRVDSRNSLATKTSFPPPDVPKGPCRSAVFGLWVLARSVAGFPWT